APPRCCASRSRPRAPPRRARDRNSSAARRREPSSELLQQTDVVLEELAQVGYAVLELGDPLDSHAEGESLDPLRVVPVLLDDPEHVGVDHPGAQDLDPADSLAERIAGAVREPSTAARAEVRHAELR